MNIISNILLFSLFSILLTNSHPYNIIFLKGSQIHKDFYRPFLQYLETKLSHEHELENIHIGDYFPSTPIKPKTIVIGHSFGGFFSLLQSIRHPEPIEACILINSHFNQRGKMPYFPLALDKVKQPTLVLLNQQDEKLPLSKAMDDYLVYRHINPPTQYHPITRKDFRVRPGNHYSTFTDPSQIEQTVEDISEFVKSLHPQTKAVMVSRNEYSISYYPSYSYLPQSIQEKTKRDELDILCQWKLPSTRVYYHLPTFLASKPGIFHCLYHPGNLYKTRNFHEEQLEKELAQQIYSLLSSTIQQTHYNTTSTNHQPVMPKIEFKKTYLPLGTQYSNIQSIRNGLFPYSLMQWLSKEPQIQYFATPFPHLVVELLVVPIIDNIVYYKLPNKLRFLELSL
jgi:hypothetical protein